MTPLLGTKTPSAPVGDKSDGERRAARSLLPCALWRGMGRLWRGMGGTGRPEPLSEHHPHKQHDLSGFHETRDTRPGYCQARAQAGANSEVFTKHESRDTKHGFYGRSVLRGCARGGVTRSRRPGHCSRRQAAVFQFAIVHYCSPLFAIVHQKILSCASPLVPPGRCFPARCGAAWGGYGAAWAARGAPSRCPRTVRTSNSAFRVFTKHETRITAFFSHAAAVRW